MLGGQRPINGINTNGKMGPNTELKVQDVQRGRGRGDP